MPAQVLREAGASIDTLSFARDCRGRQATERPLRERFCIGGDARGRALSRLRECAGRRELPRFRPRHVVGARRRRHLLRRPRGDGRRPRHPKSRGGLLRGARRPAQYNNCAGRRPPARAARRAPGPREARGPGPAEAVVNNGPSSSSSAASAIYQMRGRRGWGAWDVVLPEPPSEQGWFPSRCP